MNSKLLNLGLGISKLATFLLLFFAFVQLAATIHWHFSRETYEQIELTNGFKADYGIGNVKIHVQELDDRKDRVIVSELTQTTMYWLLIRGLFFTVTTWFIIRHFMQIIRSIADLKTFYDSNVNSLRSIGKLALITSFVSAVNFGNIGNGWDVHFTIPWTPIFTALIAYIMAEVFSEGKMLQEDKNMIV